jgi:hypothetical protein
MAEGTYYALRPSSAAFAINGTVVTDNHSSCPRGMIFKAELNKPDYIDPKYQIMGARGEDMYQADLEQLQPWAFHKEYKVTDYFEGVKRNGRVDFLVHHPDFRVACECKTTQSKAVFNEVFIYGRPKIGHLAQVVFYLIMLEETRGKLIYRYWPTQEVKTFKVEVSDTGRLLIDGTASEYSVADQLSHQLMCVEAITTQDKPEKIPSRTCRYCLYKEECRAFDTADCTIKEFIEEIKNDQDSTIV